MYIKNKFLALFVCICMFTSMTTAFGVSAATNPDAKKLADFQDFVNNTAYIGSGFKADIRTSNNGGNNIMGYSKETGVFGKAPDDASVRIHATDGEVSAGNLNEEAAMLRFSEPSARIEIEKGQYYELSYDMALDNSYSPFREIRVYSEGLSAAYLMQISTLGNVTFPFLDITSPVFTMADKHWYNFRIVIKSNNTDTSVTDEIYHDYWLYVNGQLVKSGSFINRERNNGKSASYFKGFTEILFMNYLRSSAKPTFKESESSQLHMDNISIAKYKSMPEVVFTKTLDFDSIGEVTDTDEAIAAFGANTGFFAPTSNTAGISGLSFEGGIFGKADDDICAKLYMTADKADVQRLQLTETNSPEMTKGDWYMFEADIAKSGTQSTMGVQQFYAGAPSSDGKAYGMLLQIKTDGSVWVVGNDTGYVVDDNHWHKYTIAIRSGDMTASDEADKNLIKLYVDNVEVFSSEFVPMGRVGKDDQQGELTGEWDFVGLNNLWLQNFKEGAYDEALAANSAAYFDNITVAHMGKTNKFDIGILDNKDPEIIVSGAENGDEFNSDSLPVITAVANDDYGIAKFEYYLDDKLVQATYDDNTITASFDNVTGGEHTLRFVAEDIYGLEVQTTLTISLVIDKTFTSYFTDFAGYKGGTHGGISTNTNSHGRFEAVNIDEKYGTSLGIILPSDVDESNEKNNWGTGGGNTPWVGVPVNSVTTPINVDFDFYVSTRPAQYSAEYGWQTTHDDFIRFGLKTTKGEINFIRIKHDNIEVFEMDKSLSIPYSDGKWYHATVSMHADNGIFGVVIKDGDEIIADVDGSLNAPVTQVRIFHAYHAQSAGALAIDNIGISSRYGLPEITPSEEGIAGGTNEFTLKLTEALMPEDVTADTLGVENEFGKVAVKKAVLTGNDLVVTTYSPIIGNMDYTFTLPGTTRFVSGDCVDYIIQNTFTANPSEFEITKGYLGRITFEFDALNKTQSDKTVTLIFQTWNKDGQVTGVKAIKKDIAQSDDYQNYSVLHGLSVSSGEILKVFVWDGLTDPKVVCPFVYTLD